MHWKRMLPKATSPALRPSQRREEPVAASEVEDRFSPDGEQVLEEIEGGRARDVDALGAFQLQAAGLVDGQNAGHRKRVDCIIAA